MGPAEDFIAPIAESWSSHYLFGAVCLVTRKIEKDVHVCRVE
jgi:hypothetical protein